MVFLFFSSPFALSRVCELLEGVREQATRLTNIRGRFDYSCRKKSNPLSRVRYATVVFFVCFCFFFCGNRSSLTAQGIERISLKRQFFSHSKFKLNLHCDSREGGIGDNNYRPTKRSHGQLELRTSNFLSNHPPVTYNSFPKRQ